MDWKLVTILVLVSIMIGCAAGVVAHEVMEPEAVAQAPYKGQKWEHVCTFVKQGQVGGTEVYEPFGEQGWEMVGIVGSYTKEMPVLETETMDSFTDSFVVCFKRPVVKVPSSIKQID